MYHFQDDDLFGSFDFEEMDSMFAGGFGSKNRDSQNSGEDQSCKTMTQKIGNIVTTYTQCS